MAMDGIGGSYGVTEGVTVPAQRMLPEASTLHFATPET
jgi:hypothetical protein